MAYQLTCEEYRRQKETCFYSYQVIINHKNTSELHEFGKIFHARRFFKFVFETDKSFESLLLRYVCTRYDNSGNMFIGFGNSRKESYEHSLCDETIYYNKSLPF